MKDNPKRYWFKRRLYGWGWVPVRWAGWVVVLFFILFLLLEGFAISLKSNPSKGDFLFFFGNLILAVVVLMIICYKNGEKPKWSWGR